MKNLQLIGKGLFSKVYRLNDTEVLIKSTDWAKECQCLYISSNLVPALHREGDDDYRMKYYPKVKSLKSELAPDQYLLYLELREIDDKVISQCRNDRSPQREYNRYDNLYKAFEGIQDKAVSEDLIGVLEDLSNYGQDIVFEISPRNVAVDNGKLVLLDCFAFVTQINETRKQTRKRYSY